MSLSSMERIKRDAWIAEMMGISYGELQAIKADSKIAKILKLRWNKSIYEAMKKEKKQEDKK